MTTVNVRTLKSKLSEYLDRASKGEAVEVLRRGAPVAWIVPADGKLTEAERKFRDLVAQGIVTLPKNPPGWSKHPLLKIRGKKLPSEMLLEDRRSRY